MRVHIDSEMREYLLDHGIHIGKDNFLTIPAVQEKRLMISESIRRPGIRTLAVPSVFGLTVLYEHQHWIVK